MEIGDFVRVRWSDGEEITGTYLKKERGFIVILSHGIEVPFMEGSATIEVIDESR
jgi:hypothetical protein